MECNYCGHTLCNKGICCPKCGKISHKTKDNKGRIHIPLDKIIPSGILMITSSIFLFLLIIFINPMFLGFSIGIFVVGVMLLVKYKEVVKASRLNAISIDNELSEFKCKYCFSQLYTEAQFCTLCGSKVRKQT